MAYIFESGLDENGGLTMPMHGGALFGAFDGIMHVDLNTAGVSAATNPLTMAGILVSPVGFYHWSGKFTIDNHDRERDSIWGKS